MAFVFNRALAKRVTTALAALVTVVGTGVYLRVIKETPTGESATRNIECFESASGSSVCIRETGSIVASGSITDQGVKIGTGTYLASTDIDTFSELQSQIADKTLVNEEDAVVFDSTIGWRGAGSGNTLLLNGGRINTVTKEMTVVLFGSGTTTATGSNVFSFPIFHTGTVVGVYSVLGEAADDGVTTVNPKIGGTNVLSTASTIDATELKSWDAATPSVIDTANDDFSWGDIISFAVATPANNPGVQLTVTLILSILATP
jgi:hypothetical protein